MVPFRDFRILGDSMMNVLVRSFALLASLLYSGDVVGERAGEDSSWGAFAAPPFATRLVIHAPGQTPSLPRQSEDASGEIGLDEEDGDEIDGYAAIDFGWDHFVFSQPPLLSACLSTAFLGLDRGRSLSALRC
jgi:hypothetical protein